MTRPSTATVARIDGDVTIGGEEYDVLDDIKALRHVPCGAVLYGDDQRVSHECPPACPHCGDRSEAARIESVVYRHSGDRFVSWRCCGNDVECEHGRLLANCTRAHGEPS